MSAPKRINYQLKYNGSGPLDVKETPVKDLEELQAIKPANKFSGLTVTVLDSDGKGTPADYWWVGDVFTGEWMPKPTGGSGQSIMIGGDDIES